jgi:lysozyme
VLRLHNDSQHAAAAAAFGMWNKAGGTVRAGLTRRRAAEAAMYLRPVGAHLQTTRGMPDFKDPRTRLPAPAIAATAGAALTTLQQVVAQVSDVWDGLSRVGVNPHVVMAVAGSLALGTLLWFVVDTYRRNSEGDS